MVDNHANGQLDTDFSKQTNRHMKQNLLALLLCTVIFSPCLAADAPPTVHWYTVTLEEGKSSREFTGSSESDANHLIADIVRPNSFITLADLRSYGSRDGTTYKWFPGEPGKLFIAGRTVLYFRELDADPATLEAHR